MSQFTRPSLEWRISYRHEDDDLVRGFFIPALSCAVHYDRVTGYFSAEMLALYLTEAGVR
jgi:hypothetical protein